MPNKIVLILTSRMDDKDMFAFCIRLLYGNANFAAWCYCCLNGPLVGLRKICALYCCVIRKDNCTLCWLAGNKTRTTIKPPS